MTTFFLLLISGVILLCVWLNNISSRIGVPTLLAFILLGIFFGNSGLIPLHFDDQNFAKEICTVALVFIMFYGGFGTRWTSVKPVWKESALLASAGVMITAGLVGLFCHFLLHWSLIESFLMGSVVSSTDAASVFSILRSKRLGLKNNTAPLLEMESGSNDPCSYMLTVIFLSLMTTQGAAGLSAWRIIWMVISQLAFGALGGVLIAKAAIWAQERIKINGAGFDSLFILAVAIASYALPDAIGGNGYLSAYIVGIMLGNGELRNKKALVGFFDGITGLMQVLIFFLLGLLARPSMLHKSVLPAAAIFLFMLIAARPLSVAAVLTPFMARKLNMLDAGEDVLKTFNDYSDDSKMQFGIAKVNASSSWNGKSLRDLALPRGLLVALVVRDGVRIAPNGRTVLQEGDTVITVNKAFDDDKSNLHEKTVKAGSELAGRHLRDYKGDGLVLLIRRRNRDIIPSGDTTLREGDRLVVLSPDAISSLQD